MDIIDLYRYLLVLIIPGFIGALAFSVAARLRTEINIKTALILDLITFTIMITGLYYLKGVYRMDDLLYEFTCLSFTRKYILLSTSINVSLGIGLGLLRRLFFWIRR